MPDLSPDAFRLVNAELHDGEQVVWSAAPRSNRLALRTLPAFVFGIPWTAFALFWMYQALRMNSGRPPFDFVFALFGLPFVLVGAAMLLSPYFLMRMARESAYVITDRRAIHIKAGLFGRVAVASFSPQQLGSLSRVQHLDGSGDVLFMHASESGRSN